MQFNCDKCGACCKNLPPGIPLNRGDGVCKYLENNLCTIYETRPDICRVGTLYDRFFKDKMTEEEYIKLTHETCDILKNKLNRRN